MTIKFTIPGRPVPKQRPRVLRSGYTYTPKQTVEYEAKVRVAAKKSKAIPQSPYIGPLHIDMVFYMPIPRSWSKAKRQAARDQQIYPTSRPDVDNLAKIIMDALNGVIYEDDAQIVDLTLHERYSDDTRTEVTMTEVVHQRDLKYSS